MDTYQPPPPLLPDLISSPMSIPPPTINSEFTSLCPLPPLPPPPLSPQPMQTTIIPQSTVISQPAIIPQPSQLPDMVASKVVEEFEKIMNNENDKVVLTNSICLLFRFSIDSVRGQEVCQLMSGSPGIMNRLYYVLLNEHFKDDDLILCYATGNLTNISKYDEGRASILGLCDSQMGNQYLYKPSLGVQSLIRSLQSRDSNVVIFAITAIHNLLLERRIELQEIAKEQIKYGLKYIVQLLDNQCPIHEYEFKVIVLDCLLILAYGNRENRLAMKESGGPYLLLRTIKENFENHPTEELIETASRVLKSLSACPANKVDIIENGGIEVLTHCIRKNNFEILKTCLWTLRNLSDKINTNDHQGSCTTKDLVHRLLCILNEYSGEPAIITCALGILANLTCNNEAIKQFICENNGVNILLRTVAGALGDDHEFSVVDKEIVEPAVCALCHLMNQNYNPNLAENARRSIMDNFNIFKEIFTSTRIISEDLSNKLYNVTFKSGSPR